MREIKFRAWNNVVEKMIYLDPLQWPLSVLKEEMDWNVMQSTGLKDKSNKDIFEGDVIQIDERIDRGKYLVAWIDKKAAWYFVQKNEQREPWMPLRAVKVIGNIYENPELMK